MNAATVSGPRSRTMSTSRDSGFGIRDSFESCSAIPKSQIPRPDRVSVFLHGDEHLALVTPDEELRYPARLNLAELASRFGCARHALTVHRKNDVALAQRAGRRTVRPARCARATSFFR